VTFLDPLLDRLAAFEPTNMPVLSLYLNTSPDQHGRDDYASFLRKELKATGKTIPLRSPERSSFERDTKRITTPEHEILKATTEALREHDGESDAEQVGHLLDQFRARQLAVVGAQATIEALTRGQVDTLIVGASAQLRTFPSSRTRHCWLMSVASAPCCGTDCESSSRARRVPAFQREPTTNGADTDMSKNNVNPNHYKVAGRARQGEDIAQARHRQKYAEALVRERTEKSVRSRKAAAPAGKASAGTGPTSSAKAAARKTGAALLQTPPGHKRGHNLVPGSTEASAKLPKTARATTRKTTAAAPPLSAKQAATRASVNLQRTDKRGKRSTAQKRASSRHEFDPMPATKAVPGAFGKEPSPPRPPVRKR
jgi:hypothetical protein